MTKDTLKKLGRSLAFGLVAALMLLSTTIRKVDARLTSPGSSDADVWCVGIDGAEVCVDSSGNLIPTTASDTTLGTASLPWSVVYAGNVVGDLSLDTSDIDSGVFNSSFISTNLGTNKLLNVLSPATGTLLCYTGNGRIGKVTAAVEAGGMDTGNVTTCAAF